MTTFNNLRNRFESPSYQAAMNAAESAWGNACQSFFAEAGYVDCNNLEELHAIMRDHAERIAAIYEEALREDSDFTQDMLQISGDLFADCKAQLERDLAEMYMSTASAESGISETAIYLSDDMTSLYISEDADLEEDPRQLALSGWRYVETEPNGRVVFHMEQYDSEGNLIEELPA